MTIATTFTIAWLPYQLNRLVMAYGSSAHRSAALVILDGTSTLSYVNSCVNPFVYALMWRPFRLSFTQVMVWQSLYNCKQIFHYVSSILKPSPYA